MFGRSETEQQDVPLIVLGLPELLIGAMESVQHSHHSIHLVEPVMCTDDEVRVINARMQKSS